MMIKKKTLPIAVISVGLGMSLLFNNSIAHEGASTEEAHPHPPAVKKDVPSEKVPSEKPSPDIALLKETVSKYMQAQKIQDFKAMRPFESWEGGKVLDDVKYIQSFRRHFQIDQLKITRMQKQANGEYKVLVWITHNPPKEFSAYIPPGKTVRSTLVQWWKKQDGKFLHLFHIERERLQNWIPMFEKSNPAPKSPAT